METHNSAPAAVPRPTVKQYNQLIALLNKQANESIGQSKVTHARFMASNKFYLLSSIGKDVQVVNNRASDQVTPNMSLIIDMKPVKQHCCIVMPNGQLAQVKHIGLIKIGPTLVLKDALYVPDFQFNVLTVSKLTKQYSS